MAQTEYVLKRPQLLILFSDVFTLGGIAETNRRLCDALDAAFPEGRFCGISLNDWEEGGARRWKNVALEVCGMNRSRNARRIVFVAKFISAVLFDRPSRILCTHVDLATLARWARIIFGIRYAVVAHGIEVWNLKKGAKFRAVAAADRILATSAYTESRLKENGIDGARIARYSFMVDTDRFRPQSKNARLVGKHGLQGKKVLFTASRLNSAERYKGHDVLFEALKLLPEEFVWLIAGEGDDLTRLRDLCAALRMESRVIFLGKVPEEDLADYFNLCDVYAMPSTGEGFGIVFLQALACGKPVVAGNRDGSLEPLMGGSLGFAVNPDSPEEVANAILSAVRGLDPRSNPAYLREQVVLHFGAEGFPAKVKHMMEDVLS